MKSYRVAPLLLALLGVAIPAAPGCKVDTVPNPAPKPTYQVVHGWPQVPMGMILGQVSGVAAESDGNVLVFRRALQDWASEPLPTNPIPDATLLRFDTSGALVSSLDPATFAMPHGLTVDSKGHLWVTDVSLQQVSELDASGNVLRTWGERTVAATDNHDASHFNRPTGVAIASDGTFYVSDGYRNCRVMKFGADGNLIMQWGECGTGPGQFCLPHGIAIGPDGNIYVADRANGLCQGNGRVEIFDSNGNYLREWNDPSKYGRPWALAFSKEGHAFVVDGGDQTAPPDRSRVIELDLTGTALSSFGSYGNQDGEMIWPHTIAIDKDDAIYVGEVGIGKRAQKFVKR